MSWWIKFGCKLTGWNANVLGQCSEASKSQLSKYTSALLILMIVWSIIGFCFAQRYIGLPIWGLCIGVFGLCDNHCNDRTTDIIGNTSNKDVSYFQICDSYRDGSGRFYDF